MMDVFFEAVGLIVTSTIIGLFVGSMLVKLAKALKIYKD